jgi:hypothetical protein
MERNDEAPRESAQALGSGRTTPTPLFLGFLGALALSAVMAFHDGLTLNAAVGFLMLAAVIAASVLGAFTIVMIWGARAGQRAEVLAQARPGAVVLRAQRAPRLAGAVHALNAEVAVVPLGLTIVADDAGFEVWSGSPEHLLRVGRAPWDAVADIRVTRVTRMGRGGGGIVVTVLGAPGEAVVELPFALVGVGMGGLFAPTGARLTSIVAALETRRIAAAVNALEYA